MMIITRAGITQPIKYIANSVNIVWGHL